MARYGSHGEALRGDTGHGEAVRGAAVEARRIKARHVGTVHVLSRRGKACYSKKEGRKTMPAFTSKYSYREGFKFSVPAQVVGETLNKLPEITSANLLEASRPEEAPTHKLFEWDDTIAAEKYRLQQAKNVIIAIKVEVDYGEPVTAFVNVRPKAPGVTAVYQPIDIAFSDENKAKTILQNAIAELKSFERKYAVLTELSGVFAEIRKLSEG